MTLSIRRPVMPMVLQSTGAACPGTLAAFAAQSRVFRLACTPNNPVPNSQHRVTAGLWFGGEARS